MSGSLVIAADAVEVRSSWKGWPSPESLKAPGRPKTSRGRLQDMTEEQQEGEALAPAAVEALAVISPDSNSGQATPTSSLTFGAITLPSASWSNSPSQVADDHSRAGAGASGDDWKQSKHAKMRLESPADTASLQKRVQSSQDLTGFDTPRSQQQQQQRQVSPAAANTPSRPRTSPARELEGGRFARHMRRASNISKDMVNNAKAKQGQQTKQPASMNRRKQSMDPPGSLPARPSTAGKPAAMDPQAAPASPRSASHAQMSGSRALHMSIKDDGLLTKAQSQPQPQLRRSPLQASNADPLYQTEISPSQLQSARHPARQAQGPEKSAMLPSSSLTSEPFSKYQQEAALAADPSAKSDSPAGGMNIIQTGDGSQSQLHAAARGQAEATNASKGSREQLVDAVLQRSSHKPAASGTQQPSAAAGQLMQPLQLQTGSHDNAQLPLPIKERISRATVPRHQLSFGSESADILNAALRADAAAHTARSGLPSYGSASSDALNAALRSDHADDGRRYSQQATSSQGSQNGLDRMDFSARSGRSLGLSRTGSAAWLERGSPLLDNSRENSRIYSKTNSSRDQVWVQKHRS